MPEPDESESDTETDLERKIEAAESAAEEAVAAAEAMERDDVTLLQSYPGILRELRQALLRRELPDRVRFALHRAVVAICERIGRACRRDLPEDKG